MDMIHIIKIFDREPDLSGVHSLAGRNNLLPRLGHRYLQLSGYSTTQHGGRWQADMFFRPLPERDAAGRPPEDQVNWRSFLGESWQVAN